MSAAVSQSKVARYADLVKRKPKVARYAALVGGKTEFTLIDFPWTPIIPAGFAHPDQRASLVKFVPFLQAGRIGRVSKVQPVSASLPASISRARKVVTRTEGSLLPADVLRSVFSHRRLPFQRWKRDRPYAGRPLSHRLVLQTTAAAKCRCR